VQTVSVAWQVYLLTDSPLQVGLIGLFRAIPIFALALAGGAMADRFDRKRVVLVAVLTSLVLTLVLAAATFVGWVSSSLVFVVVLIGGAAATFDFPARQALLPHLVPREELSNAFALNTLMRQSAFVIGPGVAGLLIGQFGLAATYALNAACFVGAAVLVLGLPSVRAVGSVGVRGQAALLGGVSYLRREPLLAALLLMGIPVNVLGNIQALMPVFARDVLLVGPQGLGMLHAATSAGAVMGGIALGGLGAMRRPVAAILWATAVHGVCMLGFALSTVFTLSLGVLFVMGISEVIAEVQRATIVQLRTPDELRGRVTAIHQVVFQGGPLVGYLESGAVASVLGPVAAVLLGGAAVVLSAAGALRVPPLRAAVRPSPGTPV
jgi:MFS family permease